MNTFLRIKNPFLYLEKIFIAVISSLIALFLIQGWLLTPPPNVLLAHEVEIVVLIGIGLLSTVIHQPSRLSQALILSLYVHFAYVAYYTGGIYAMSLDWIGFLPACTLLLGWRSTLFWTICSAGLITGFLVHSSQADAQVALHLVGYAPWGVMLNISITIGLVFHILLYEGINDINIKNIVDRKNILLQKQNELIKAQSHKDEFIAVVSHELRTPLNAILGFTQLMYDALENEALKVIQHIQNSSKQLLQIISDILDFSQLQSLKLRLIHDEISPVKILQEAVQRHQEDALKKNLCLSLFIASNWAPQKVWVDEFRLSQVLDQLLSNAIKFSQSGRIEIHLKSHVQGWSIEVIDQGIGISAIELENIFNGFQHASVEVQHRYGGTGLGLAISQKIIELHHGSIRVQSELHQGSTFSIVLPIDCRVEPTPSTQSSEAATPFDSTSTKPTLFRRLYNRALQQFNRLDPKCKMYIFFLSVVDVGLVMFCYIAPYPEALQGCLTLAVVFQMAIALLYLNIRLSLVIGMVQISICAVIVYLCLYSGGVFSSTVAWLSLITLSPLYLQGAKPRLFWIPVPLLMNIGLAYLQLAPPAGLNLTVSTQHFESIWAFMGHIDIMIIVMALPLTYKYIRKKTNAELLQQNQYLSEVQQALLLQKQAKNQFIASITHALRTPMNVIIGFNDLLKDEMKQKTDMLDLQAFVSQAAQHLLTVIDDILDYSQLETGKLKLKDDTFNLPIAIRHAYQMFDAIQHSNAVSFHLKMGAIPVWVKGDEQRLTQILVNLLSNAMKFTQRGEVRLTVEPHADGVRFEVKDTGSGIDPHQLEHIFERFEQANNRQHRTQGHGLGLSITKRLIEAQQGWIKAQSEIGKGSCFVFWLHFETAVAPSRPVIHAPLALSAQQPFTILIVDDQPLNRVLARQVLQRAWSQVLLIEAENGLQALEQLKKQPIDLVLMDMLMPEMDGVTATYYIRHRFDAPICHVPILGLTANANDDTRHQCLEAGMNDLIYKPFKREDLIRSIQGLIDQPHLSTAA